MTVATALLYAGCEDAVLGDRPKSDPEEVFEILWNDFDKTYSYFQYKKVDWDSIYAVHRPQVNAGTGPDRLFEIFSNMLDDLKDGHVNLYASKSRQFSYDGWKTEHPHNYIPQIIEQHYLERPSSTRIFTHASLRGQNLAYIHIDSFGGTRSEFQFITDLLELYRDHYGIIIDVRDNGGGSDSNSKTVASQFTEISFIYSYYRYKNGPGHNDFTEWYVKTLNPADERGWAKPVALLTNRRCFSSCEDFVLSMREIPTVTVIGDTTGGGSGNPINRELPNGWSYRLSRWQSTTLGLRLYEGRGLNPKIPVWITESDSLNGRDTILDRAIEELGID